MKDSLLFSDVHLKPSFPANDDSEAFTAFLRKIDPVRVGRLICLGDLFDFWYEYRHAFFSAYFEVLRLLANLRDAGVECHLICGNHDLWAGSKLELLTGMQIHHVPVVLPFGGEEALLLHGDGLNPHDHGYLLFRRLARNRFAQALFRRLHPDTAMAIAQRASRHSRARANMAHPADSPEVEAVRSHAHHLIAAGQTKIVICGHAHVPAIEPVEENGFSGLYINPGDWPTHRSYVLFSDGAFRLLSFS